MLLKTEHILFYLIKVAVFQKPIFYFIIPLFEPQISSNCTYFKSCFKKMGNYEKLFEDTKQIICIAFDVEVFNTNKLEDTVSGIQISPSFIESICEFASMIEDALELKNLGSYRIDAMSCYESYLKNGNPMGFHLMLSKLLPALECPHTILTTGPVKKRLVTKKARLLLINFLVSVILLGDDIFNIYQKQPSVEKSNKRPLYKSQDGTKILGFINCGMWVIGPTTIDR